MNEKLSQFYLERLLDGTLTYNDVRIKARDDWWDLKLDVKMIAIGGRSPDDDHQRFASPEFQQALEIYEKAPLIAALK